VICPHCLSDNPADVTACRACGRDLGGGSGPAAGRTGDPPPAPPGSFEPGRLLAGRYELVRELGRGSLGVVHLARDRELGGRETALKIIYPALRRRPAYLERLTEVLRVNQDLTHPGIATVFDLDGEGEWTFVVAEYVPAPSLREIMNQRAAEGRRFTLDEALAVVTPVLDALAYAHRHRTHTDLKPENVLVSGEVSAPRVKLTDFGTADVLSPALFTTTAQGLGTARYLSPEQVAGERGVGPATDLYAVGVIFYEMLTGRPPTGRFALPGEIVPGLPAGVDRVTARALGPSPADRFRSAAEFRDALVEAAREPRGRPATPEATPVPSTPGRTEGTGRSWLKLGGQLALGLVALIVLMVAVKFILLDGPARRGEQVAAFLTRARTAISAGRLPMPSKGIIKTNNANEGIVWMIPTKPNMIWPAFEYLAAAMPSGSETIMAAAMEISTNRRCSRVCLKRRENMVSSFAFASIEKFLVKNSAAARLSGTFSNFAQAFIRVIELSVIAPSSSRRLATKPGERFTRSSRYRITAS